MTLLARWQRLRYAIWSPVYDLVVKPFAPARRRAIELLNLQGGERVLIPGVGTGADLPLIPPGVEVTGTDLTPAMLRRARAHERSGVALRVMDAAALDFPDGSFDVVILNLILAVMAVVGAIVVLRLPVDVFPDLSAPTVTVITEATGMAPEEVELQVTFPVESSLNGAPGVRRIRSMAGPGITVTWVEFAWGEEVYRARQVVAERLQNVDLPAGVERPQMGPISSIMGEITFIALTSETVSAMELRRISETTVRRSLLAVPGISQVVPIGGDVREYVAELDPSALAQARLSVDDVVHALEQASAAPAAGFHVDAGQEFLVRGLGRARSADDLAQTVLRQTGGVPLRLGQVARVHLGAEPLRGTASYRARPAVILSVQKQPGTNTLELTRHIDRVLADLERTLPRGVRIEKENFRQADFVEIAVHNVSVALRDGAILVLIVLVAFLGSWRATLISAVAIPLSLVAGVLVISALGGTLNTMTLGGFTIAIGALVDDAIIDVENVSAACARTIDGARRSGGRPRRWCTARLPRSEAPSFSPRS